MIRNLAGVFAKRSWAFIVVGCVLGIAPALLLAQQDQCVVAGNVETLVLPPEDCGYLTETEVHMLIEGLPPDTVIMATGIHGSWTDVVSTYTDVHEESAGSKITFDIVGTGMLDGFEREIVLRDVQLETVTEERLDGVAFDTEMMGLDGSLGSGDADFETLILRVGANNDLPPSPGTTTLTQLTVDPLDPPQVLVDSSFDLNYTLEFVGAAGGQLDLRGVGLGKLSGTTSGVITMASYGESCGNDIKEGQEGCDGTDDARCPGLCQLNCACPTADVPALSPVGIVLLVAMLLAATCCLWLLRRRSASV